MKTQSRFQFLSNGRVGAFAFLIVLFSFAGLTPARSETLLLKGATVHTVSGETLSPGDVLIRDKEIFAVGKDLPATGVTTINLTGMHLYPGLIALNTELGLVEINAVRATRDDRESGDYTPEVQSAIAVNPDSELIPVARANGIACFEPVPHGGVVAGQSGLMTTAGWTTEQMTFRKPNALHVFWPVMELNLAPRELARDKSKWKSPADQAKERSKKLKALDDFFADARAYAQAREAATQANKPFQVNPSWESLLPVLRGDVVITVHADEERQIEAAVKWAATNKLKIVIAGGRDAAWCASSLATNRVPVIFGHVFTQPVRDTDSYDALFRAPGVLFKAGVKVAISPGGAALIKNMPYDAAQAAAFGLPPEEAIRAITLYPAQISGVADRLGSIEPGKQATLFVTDGDLLDIRSNVKRFWIAGQEVSLENRHTRLYEKYRNRPKAR